MTERATKSGIAAEAFNKVQSKFEPALASSILRWVSECTGETIHTDGRVENFVELFRDGTLLCRLANALVSNSIKKINTSQMAFKKMENISFFLAFAARYVDKSELFQTVDLYESQDPNAVLVCLSALARKSSEAFGRPGLGPREAKADPKQWTKEQLHGDSVIGLQMGFNKGASQSGMIIGNTRHIRRSKSVVGSGGRAVSNGNGGFWAATTAHAQALNGVTRQRAIGALNSGANNTANATVSSLNSGDVAIQTARINKAPPTKFPSSNAVLLNHHEVLLNGIGINSGSEIFENSTQKCCDCEHYSTQIRHQHHTLSNILSPISNPTRQVQDSASSTNHLCFHLQQQRQQSNKSSLTNPHNNNNKFFHSETDAMVSKGPPAGGPTPSPCPCCCDTDDLIQHINGCTTGASGGGCGSSATSTTSAQNASFAAAVAAMAAGGTIEDQIKFIDRIMKECDTSRKNLEQINRRLDDLNDEVRRYREFLGHEKSRRDPAIYKTTNIDHPSTFNDSICSIIGTLTQQLAMEWNEKLRAIQTTTLLPKPNDKN